MGGYRGKFKLGWILSHFILLSASIIILIPLLWMVLTAFKSRDEVFSKVPNWIPTKLIFSNFSVAWNLVPFRQYYVNTVIVTFGLLFVQLITITLAAYAFARLEFKGRDILFMLFLTQMMITPQSTIVPNYLTIKALRLLDTRLAIMLPYFASAFGTFLLRQAFKTIPQDLEDAAKIDGCGGLRFLWYVAIPLMKPTYLAFSLISIVYHWNEFFWPLIVTDTPKARTLTIGLGVFAQQTETGAEWTLLMAATLIVILPLLVLFTLFQRRFIQSFMASGIKG